MDIRTVADLIDRLREFPEDAEVFLATQPSWPFEHGISDVIGVGNNDKNDDEYDDEYDDDDNSVTRVYLGDGGQIRYLPGDAAKELGWY